MGDVFADPDQPQQSELLWESDFCAYKPQCDVLVINAASRPGLNDWQRSISIHRNPDLVPRAKRWGCAVMLDWVGEEGRKQYWHKRLDVISLMFAKAGEQIEIEKLRKAGADAG